MGHGISQVRQLQGRLTGGLQPPSQGSFGGRTELTSPSSMPCLSPLEIHRIIGWHFLPTQKGDLSPLVYIKQLFFFFFCHIHGMWKLPNQGQNPSHSSDPSHYSDNACRIFNLLCHKRTLESYYLDIQVKCDPRSIAYLEHLGFKAVRTTSKRCSEDCMK